MFTSICLHSVNLKREANEFERRLGAGGGGRFLPGNFLLGICRWMGRMFTAGLSIMEFHSHHSCGRTLLGDSG